MTTLTVTQVNKYIKAIIEEIPNTRNIYVAGEISNFKHYYQSGHMYFTLKDSSSQLKCVMFAFDNEKLKFKPEDGMNVVCFGQISVYERDGQYQLYVRGMQPKGIGSLAVAYEQLKAKLEEKGYFDESIKKPLPKYPNRVGVATSNMGAAVEDIKNVITRRYPICEIIICPTIVQGEAASSDIARSIKILDDMNLDVIIVGRGGGSIEDLWAFNTEIVADAVYNCKTPIISAVGHETDFTICDFVADRRAATPSAAAELAVPDIQNEIIAVNNFALDLDREINSVIEREENRLKYIVEKSILSNVNDVFDKQFERLENISNELNKIVLSSLENRHNEISRLAGLLNAYSPLAILGRGYSISLKDNAVLSSTKNVSINDDIDIKLFDGILKANVKEVIIDEWNDLWKGYYTIGRNRWCFRKKWDFIRGVTILVWRRNKTN